MLIDFSALLRAWMGLKPVRRRRPARRKVSRPIEPRSETLECRVMLTPDIFVVPGNPEDQVSLSFLLTRQETKFKNEVGVYVVDDASGRVNGQVPGTDGYARAVMNDPDRHILFPYGGQPGASEEIFVTGGTQLAFYLVKKKTSEFLLDRDKGGKKFPHSKTLYFSASDVSKDKYDHAQSQVLPNGDTQYNWKDRKKRKDPNFDDSVYSITATIAPHACAFEDDLTGWTARELGGGPAGKGTVTAENCEATLVEGDSFNVTLSRTFLVTAASPQISFDVEDAEFDASESGAIHDAFEVALLDDAGRSLVPTYAAGRDAFYNASEGLAAIGGTTTTITGHHVVLDLSGIPAGTAATLVFRLVNNDSDLLTRVTLANVDVPDASASTVTEPQIISPASTANASPDSEANHLISVTGAPDNASSTPLTSTSTASGASSTDIQLDFDTLPSAQGWTFLRSGNNAVEELAYSVDGVALHQDTIPFPDFGSGSAYYRIPLALRPDVPFTVEFRARVTEEVFLGNENRRHEGTGIQISSNGEMINVVLGEHHIVNVRLNNTDTLVSADIDNTVYHDYRLEVTPHAGGDLFVDDVFVGHITSEAYGGNEIDLGDLGSAGSARADYSYFRLSQAGSHQVSVTASVPDIQVAANSSVLLTGHAESLAVDGSGFSRPIATVLVNGVPVEVLDSTGNFFTSVPVLPGINGFAITAIDSEGVSATTELNVQGIEASSLDLSQFEDVTGSFAIDYARTSFADATRMLYVDSAVHNAGQYPANVPLLVGIRNISEPSVVPLHPAGFTTEGIPYYDFTNLVTGGTLTPGAASGKLTIPFFDPQRIQFTYDLVFLGQLNHSPEFNTTPVISAAVDRTWQYAAGATDPDGDTVSWKLLSSPPDMQINPVTGVITWVPDNQDFGTHEVTVQAADGRGGAAEQHFVLTVRAASPNRPPVISSQPVVETNDQYQYDVQAVDPDSDSLTYTLTQAPAEMVINATTGLISWAPVAADIGHHTITTKVTDGHGGETTQTFILCVNEAPDNHDPIFVSTPVTFVKSGPLFVDAATITLVNPPDAAMQIERFASVIGPTAIMFPPSGSEFELGSLYVASRKIGSDASDPSLVDYIMQVRPDGGVTLVATLAAEADPSDIAFAPLGSGFGDYLYVSSNNRDGDRPADQGGTIQRLDASGNLTDFTAIGLPDGLGEPGGITFSHGNGFPDQLFVSNSTDPPASLNTVNSAGLNSIFSIENGAVPRPQIVDVEFGPGGDFGTDLYFLEWESVAGSEYRVGVVDAAGQTRNFATLPGGPGVLKFAPGGAFGNDLYVSVSTPQGDSLVRINAAGVITTVATGFGSQRPLGTAGLIPTIVGLEFSADGNTLYVSDFYDDTVYQISKPPVTYQYDAQAVDPDHDALTYQLGQHPDGMVIDSSTGLITWQLTTNVAGNYSVTVQVRDGRGGITTQDYVIISGQASGQLRGTKFNDLDGDGVRDVGNGSPVEPGLAGWTIYLDQNQNGRLDPDEASTTTDALGDYAFLNLPAGNYTVAEVPQPRWEQTTSSLQTDAVSLTAGQIRSGLNFGSQPVIESGNHSPAFSGTPPTSAIADALFRYDIEVTDTDGDALTFDLPAGPSGMTVHPQLGIVVWTPTSEQIGTFAVVVRAKDGHGGVALQSFNVAVTSADIAPTITSVPPNQATVGLPFLYAVRAQDADGDVLTYALVSPPAGMQINSTTGVATWNPTAPQLGGRHVEVSVTDGRGGEALQEFDVTVYSVTPNLAPSVTLNANPLASPGATWYGQILASDANGDPLTFELPVHPAGMTIDSTGLLRWQPTAADLGSHSARVKVSDGRPDGEVVIDFSIEVAVSTGNHAPVITSVPVLHATDEDEYSLQLTSTDEDQDPVVFSLVTAPRGMSLDPLTGSLRWLPDDEQLGIHEVVVKVQDPHGEFSTQRFVIDVDCANQAPAIVSLPVTSAVVGSFYSYSVRAIDPEGDRLTFAMLSAPAAGMSFSPATGLLTWTPTGANLGQTIQVALRVGDGEGNLATQTFAIVVSSDASPAARNRPPVITSAAPFNATLNQSYLYQVVANDPEGDTLSYSLQDHPAGMTINSSSGLVSWTPTSDQAGQTVVTIIVRDESNGVATQSFGLSVRANQPPTINSMAPATVQAGAIYRYDVRASDPDGDALTYRLTAFPQGMTIDDLGRIRWSVPAGFDSSVRVLVTVSVTDAFGNSVAQSFSIGVQPDTTPPLVLLTSTANLFDEQQRLVVDQDGTVVFRVVASDNVGLASSRVLTVDGVSLPLDANNAATWLVNRAGIITAVATATDLAGNVSTSTLTLRARDPNDVDAPLVEITSPDQANLTNVVTYLTQVVGSVHDDQLLGWHLDYALASAIDLSELSAPNPAWVQFASGSTNVDHAQLGTFDPTLLLNDQYIIRLYAEDTAGNINTRGVLVSLQGTAKLGNFHLEFNDLSIPLAGIPITITRVYDTLQASQKGDFGYGWSLGVSSGNIRETVQDNGGDFFTAVPFRDGTRVYITAPDGKRVGFTFQPELQGSAFFGVLAKPRFIPDPGVYYQLEDPELSGFSLQRAEDGTYHGFLGIGNYNPDSYILTAPDGIRYTYNQHAGLQTATDHNGNTLTFTPEGIFSSVGVSVQFHRDGQDRITQIIDPAGNTINYQYDAAGNLISFVDQLDNKTTFTYKTSPAHYLDTILDPLHRPVARAEYDANGRLIGITDGNNFHTQQSFDPNSFSGTYTDANENVTNYVYDTRGNIVSKTDAEGGVTLYAFNDPQNPNRATRVTDPNHHETTYTYDARGNITGVTDATGIATSRTFDSLNHITSMSDGRGNTTTYVYDTQGNLVQAVDGSGASQSLTRDPNGRITSSSDAMGHVSVMTYEPGCPCGTPDEVTNPDGTVRSFEQNDLMRVTKAVDENGGITINEYDDRGLLIATTDANGHKTQFGYDAAGNRTSVTDPDNNVTSFEYDVSNHVIKETDPLGHDISYRYDGVGNLIRKTDRNGRVITYEYDGANHLLFERWRDTSDTLVWTIAYTYDAAGNQLTVTDPDGTIIRTYDELNRIKTESNTGTPGSPAVTLTYQYDATGNVASITDNTGVRVASLYDNRNQLIERTWQGGGINPARIDFSYDANGQRTEIRRYTDLAGTQLSLATDISYTVRGQTDSLISTNQGGSVLLQLEYEYTLQGLLHVFHNGSQSVTYSYDSLGQLISADYANNSQQPDELFHYDANGNRDSAGNVVTTGNRLSSDGEFSFEYDNEGNLIRKAAIAAGGGFTTFDYDYHNRLTSVTAFSSTGGVVSQTQYQYDPEGRRISTTTNGVTVRSIYNGVDVWADYDSSGSLSMRYLHGDSVDQLLARQGTGQQPEWYATGRLGTVHALVSAAGLVENRVTYSAFGTVVSQSNPAISDRFLFTGRELDSTTGLYYYRARSYDPVVGRFTTMDPLPVGKSEVNTYRYALNTPVNLVDPLGTDFLGEGVSLLVAVALNSVPNTNSPFPGGLTVDISAFYASTFTINAVDAHSFAFSVNPLGSVPFVPRSGPPISAQYAAYGTVLGIAVFAANIYAGLGAFFDALNEPCGVPRYQYVPPLTFVGSYRSC